MDYEEKIIEFVRNNKCLWKKNDKDFKNNFKRDKLWSVLATELGVSNEKLKGRWKTLRNTFRMELSKNKGKPSGSGASVSVPVKWRFFQQMQFLKNEMISRPTLSGIELSGTKSASTPIPGTSRDDTPEFLKFEHYDLQQKETVVAKKKLDDVLIEVSKAISNCKEEEQSEIDTFFQSIVTKVKSNNLNQNEWDDFQEHILSTTNKKLRSIRSNKN